MCKEAYCEMRAKFAFITNENLRSGTEAEHIFDLFLM